MTISSIQKLIDLTHYTEGPAIGADGSFYFTTLSGGKIGKLSQHGEYTEWGKGPCPNGQVILSNGDHLFCDSATAGIVKHSSSGKLLEYIVLDRCAGEKVSTPNDLIIDSVGNIYFTDSIRSHGKVFFKGVDGSEKVVATGIDYANGLALSKDECYLFVAESFQNRLLKLEIKVPGVAASAPEVFFDLPKNASGNITDNLPDGLKVDRDGNIWVAHYGMGAVQVISSKGELRASLSTSLPLTSNLCFVEDEDGVKTVLITGGFGEPGPGAVVLMTVTQ